MSSIFNKQKFVTEPTFQFENFEPIFNWNGMTASSLTVYSSRLLKIRSVVWVSIQLNVTLAAPLTVYYTFSIPYTVRNPDRTGASVLAQGLSGNANNVGTLEAALVYGRGGGNMIEVYRPGAAVAYGAGVHALRANFFVEVED